MTCLLCRDGYPIIMLGDMKLHEALGFTWACDAPAEAPTPAPTSLAGYQGHWKVLEEAARAGAFIADDGTIVRRPVSAEPWELEERGREELANGQEP